ncbi:MAG: GHKL domain-containing protein [Peptostreptococcaceae bacterium]|nr:GHKL domain-containing protein [Peptostreptococcaceae bacterium]
MNKDDFVTNMKNKKPILPLSYRLGLGIVPLFSLMVWIPLYTMASSNIEGWLVILLLYLFYSAQKTSLLVFFLITILLNIANFYFYKHTVRAVYQEGQQNLLDQQNEYYDKQLEIMQDYMQDISKVRHDIKNHLLAIESYKEQDKIEAFSRYLDSVKIKVEGRQLYSQTGNSVIDSIVNYKLGTLKDDVDLVVDIRVPSEISVSDFDITTILGNLLDNAIRAVEETKGDKKLSFAMQYRQGRLLIEVSNSYEKLLQSKSEGYVTTKRNRRNHGFGLKNIQDTVRKYDGTVSISHTQEIFSVQILMFVG